MALTQVLLASQVEQRRKPILVVAVTNQALDSFLKSLFEIGVTNLARLGGGSKEDWLERFKLRHLSRAKKVRSSCAEMTRRKDARLQAEGKAAFSCSD